MEKEVVEVDPTLIEACSAVELDRKLFNECSQLLEKIGEGRSRYNADARYMNIIMNMVVERNIEKHVTAALRAKVEQYEAELAAAAVAAKEADGATEEHAENEKPEEDLPVSVIPCVVRKSLFSRIYDASRFCVFGVFKTINVLRLSIATLYFYT